MKRGLTILLLLLVASAMGADAQTLHGVTDKTSGGGTPVNGGGNAFPSLLDMPSPFVGGLN